MPDVRRLRALACAGCALPVQVAMGGSLLLSLIAWAGSGTLNRDGMVYVSIADVILAEGMASALTRFDWLVMPALMAGLSWLTGISPESAGFALGALLLAGACALSVACAQRLFPGTAWAACLVVLALPAINAYRDQIVRESGYWFFCMLALWLALRWSEHHRWREAVLAQLAIVAAACFRLEAVVIYPALFAWQLFLRDERPAVARLTVLSVGPLLAVGCLVVLETTGVVSPDVRLAAYLDVLDFPARLEQFSEAAQQIAGTALHKVSRSDGPTVLLVGLLALIPIKFVSILGVFVVPLGYLLASGTLRAHLQRWAPMAWLCAIYLLVLIGFVTKYLFVASRYVSFLDLMAIPLIAAGLVMLHERWTRVARVVVVLALVTMLSNVVSMSAVKTDVIEAGRWVARHAPELERVAFHDQRVAYYAGAGYWPWIEFDRETALARLAAGELDYVVVRVGSTTGLQDEDELRERGLAVASRFERPNGSAVVVLRSSRAEAAR